MPKYGPNQVSLILVDGYDLVGLSTELTDEGVSETIVDTRAFGGSVITPEFLGLKEGSVSTRAWYDDDTSKSADALEMTGVSRLVLFGVEGNAIGRRVVAFSGSLQNNVARESSLDSFHRIRASFKGSGKIDDAVILHALATESGATGDTESTSVDNTASSANGGRAYLQVPELTLGGYTNFVVTIRHSTDNITFADHTSFSVVTTSPVAVLLALAGTINRYTAISWAYTGAGSGQSAKFLVALKRD